MDTKVIIEVVCPHCHSKIMMKKYKEITSKIIKCPGNGCGKELNIQFDTTKDPQTYIILEEATQKEQNKTIYKKSVNQENDEQNTKKTRYGKDKRNTPHNYYNDLDEKDEDFTNIKRRHNRLRDKIYLTHITWFGLRNKRFQLYEGTTTIGRYDEDATSDIMIRGDETMSRKSVAISIEEVDGIFDYKLKVLHATNKVKVNDKRIKEGAETFLDFGDIIMLGNSKFKFDNH